MSPTNVAIKGPITGLSSIRLARVSSPIKCIAVLRIKDITTIYINIVKKVYLKNMCK